MIRCVIAAVLAALAWGGAATPAQAGEKGLPEIKEAYLAELQALQATRTGALVRLLELNLENAEVMLKDKTRTRNVTGMAVANNAKTLFDNTLSNLLVSGQVELPAKVRRELEPMVEAFKAAQAHVEEEYLASRKALQERLFEPYREAVARANPLLKKEAVERKDYETFLEARPAPPIPLATSAMVTNSGPVTSAVVAVAASNQPAFWGSRGEARNWVTIARWEARVGSMDVITIPVTQMQPGSNKSSKPNPIAGMDSQFDYQLLFAYPTKGSFPVRLKSVAGRSAGDVVEWPGPGNEFVLTVRVTAQKYPSTHAFELQVGVTNAATASLFSGAALENAAGEEAESPPVQVVFLTQPAGAAVTIDGVPQKEARTPCRLPVKPGAHTIELSLLGYEPVVLSNEMLTVSRTLQLKLHPDPRVVAKTVAVAADNRQWYPSGILIPSDAVVSVKAEGEWACGSKGERCVATGYPLTVPTYKHYADPALRQFPGANYGALLGRIGRDGAIFTIGSSVRFTATNHGMLYLDVNESTGTVARSDNSGTLTVHVGIIPQEGRTAP